MTVGCQCESGGGVSKPDPTSEVYLANPAVAAATAVAGHIALPEDLG